MLKVGVWCVEEVGGWNAEFGSVENVWNVFAG